VLAVDGHSVASRPYRERRELLEALNVEGAYVALVATFEDREALFAAVCERGLEGVVAKRERHPYRPGERGWVKHKNRATERLTEQWPASGNAGRARDAAGISA
jgi:bifunctional non-homologous end joining protein LigD